MQKLKFTEKELEELKDRKAIILIDTSDMFHRCYHTQKGKKLLGEEAGAVLGYLNYYYQKLKSSLELDNIQEIIHILDPIEAKSKYRTVFPDYKGHREPDLELNRQKYLFRECLQILQEKYIEVEETESDDIIGTLAKYYAELGFYVCIYGRDKDLKQLIEDGKVCVYSFDKVKEGDLVYSQHILHEEKEVKEKYGVSPNQMAEFLAICGNVSDNIRGVNGVGEKSASNLLNTYQNIFGIYRSLDELPPKTAEKFKKDKDILLLAKKLTTIQTQNEEILEIGIRLNHIYAYGLNKVEKRSGELYFRDKPITKEDFKKELEKIAKYYHIEECFSNELTKAFYLSEIEKVENLLFSNIDPLNILEHYVKILPNYYLNISKERYNSLKTELLKYV